MTEDFDLIQQTFENIHQALADIGLLKNYRATEGHFAERLTNIFISLFEFCLFCTNLFKSSRKRKSYIIAHYPVYI
jgi:hypothetical protein